MKSYHAQEEELRGAGWPNESAAPDKNVEFLRLRLRVHFAFDSSFRGCTRTNVPASVVT